MRRVRWSPGSASVAAGMAVFVVAVYILVVLGGGALIGRTDSPHVGLSVLATAAVAIGFEPVRARLAQHVAPSPYDVLTRFAAGVGAGVADDDVLARMSQLLAEGTGAVRAQVWWRRGNDETLAASYPPAGAPLPVAGPGIRSHEVRHRAEVLGRVSLQERPGHPLTPLEERLFADLARQSGLALRNVRLTAELRAHVTEAAERAEELRASRERIVAAHDEARRRIERNIHDGAQQHLVALAVNLRLAQTLAERNPARATAMLPDLSAALEQTVATLTELSSGLYPRVLAERGLAEALSSASRMSAVPVEVHAEGLVRYGADLEAAVYFSCLEAVQNAAKHAGAARVDVVLESHDDGLEFRIVDDGRGFDPGEVDASGSGLANMRDRVAAVGGELVVRSQPGEGTRVEGSIPVPRHMTEAT